MVKTVKICGCTLKAYDSFVPDPPRCCLCGRKIFDVPRIIWLNDGELEIDLCGKCFNKIFTLDAKDGKVFFKCRSRYSKVGGE